MKYIDRLQFITAENAGISHIRQVELVCHRGIKWVQLRMKNRSNEEMIEIARDCKQICDDNGSVLIINDYVQIANEVRADGVHLGMNDMPVSEARKVLGEKVIIGATANNAAQFRNALQTEADYIGLGPYRFTKTKENLSPVLDKNQLREILSLQNEKPVVLIGGITENDIEDIRELGAFGVAMSSGILSLIDHNNSIKRLKKQLKYERIEVSG